MLVHQLLLNVFNLLKQKPINLEILNVYLFIDAIPRVPQNTSSNVDVCGGVDMQSFPDPFILHIL